MRGDYFFGGWLMRARKARYLTQRALAERVGCSEGQIRKVEQGQRRCSEELAKALMKHLRVRHQHRLALIRWAAGGPAPVPLPPFTPTAGGAPKAKISIGRLPSTGRDCFGREQVLGRLDEAWRDPGIAVVSLVAWGGVGKSALVNHWLRGLRQDDYRGAQRVYAWSFHSQGATDRVISSDQFVESALRWFGDDDPNRGSPWDKGERLAGLVREHRTLLLLDGLEPLQYPPGPEEGALKDQALRALLRELAALPQDLPQSLCVISTRVPVTDLEDSEGSTALRIDLEHLSPRSGAQLLKAQGVEGDQAELEQAAREFGGHALALTLLAGYLTDAYGGDVRRWREVGDLEEDERHGGHARRVMASYERWFGEGPELAVLRLLGLFDHPADGEAVDAVRADPAIPGLTDALQDLSKADWRRVLAKLRRAGLLAARDRRQPDALEAHPLVRDHFGQQLRRGDPPAWREGNRRLYEHLKRTAKPYPDTVEELAPLYAAVAHGCRAGLHQEALEEVLWQRISRGGEYFSSKKLGAFGADLAALLGFFEQPWHQTVPGLSEVAKAAVLNQAGFCLRALGRLPEAPDPMLASLKLYRALRNYQWAAIVAGNLSEVYQASGDLARSLNYAHQSVELADRSGDPFERVVERTTLADALHQAGCLTEAADAFREAEALMTVRKWEDPTVLDGRLGFRYCDLLLTLGEWREVRERASQTLRWVSPRAWLLEIALDNLSLGRAHLLQAQVEHADDDLVLAARHLDHAVDGLRRAVALDYLPRALMARAELRRLTGALELARADLDEALSISERGQMGLHQADCHLNYARLYLARGQQERARSSLATAGTLIAGMGYQRRNGELAELEQMVAA